eukprot:Nitzschia sp. Nitz4//scaffold80_size88189//16117//17797//NITZ4_005081-RA/size88189-processed-gene-0.27-mRNA-1//-1//CDS//3329558612//8163//frame0
METTEATSTPAKISLPPRSRVPPKFIDKPFSYHLEMLVDVTEVGDMGLGLGHVSKDQPSDIVLPALPTAAPENEEESKDAEVSPLEDWSHWKVHVPMVLPGEKVRVRIFKNFDGYSEADLVQVVQPSSVRVQPKCPLAGRCGGCQLQHVEIETQRTWKTDHVRQGLLGQKIEGYSTEEQINAKLFRTAGTDQVYEYRSKLTPHYEAPKRNAETEEYEMGPIGFQQCFSKEIIDVEECPIATPAINAKYKETRSELLEKAKEGVLNGRKKRKRGRRNKGDAGATLLFREADNDEQGNPVVITDNKEYMNTTVKGITFRYQAGNFFQNNNYVIPLMVDGVLDAAIAKTAAGKTPRFLIDCYCGSGLFALTAASKFELCIGIEVQEKAIEEATENATSNGIKNCQFMAASAEAIFKSPPQITLPGFESLRVQEFPRDETVVVLDPPRKGCSEEFLQQLYEYAPQRVVYMSCGPNTQARDAKGIVEVGGYEIVSIQPYDLFPQTRHVECLMIFEKKSTESK